MRSGSIIPVIPDGHRLSVSGRIIREKIGWEQYNNYVMWYEGRRRRLAGQPALSFTRGMPLEVWSAWSGCVDMFEHIRREGWA